MLAKGIKTHGHLGRDAGAESGPEDELSTLTLPPVTSLQSTSGRAMETETMQTPYANVSEVPCH